jgi:sugar phosphate isomerase/epimerase
MPSQIAVQLYTLREFTKTPADIAKTLKRVRDIGYEAVQLSALGPIDARDLKKLLDDNGLTCCATHVGLDRMKSQTRQVIDDHLLWNCKYTAVGGFFPKAEDFSLQTWSGFVREYNEIAKLFANSGVALGYHNHSHEFARVDHRTAWQLLLETFAPDIWIEVDTYWVQHGGGDPAAWIDRLAGRVPCVHLKDLGMKPDRTHQIMEVGQGNMNWPGILAACQRAGVEWYIVEQDTCYRDPFESVKISLDYVRSLGLK